MFEDSVELDTIRVVETSGGGAAPIDAAAYAEPSGEDPMAFWTAPGTTYANAERRFMLYYNKAAAPPPYAFSWRTATTFIGSFLREFNCSKRFYYVTGNRLEIKRGAIKDPSDGTCMDVDTDIGKLYGVNPGLDFSHLTDVASGFSPLDGFLMTYALRGSDCEEAVAFSQTEPGANNFDRVAFDANGPSAAVGFHYSRAIQRPHELHVAHRLFNNVPLLEWSVGLAMQGGGDARWGVDLDFSRQALWKSGFAPTRMVSDTRGDEPIAYNEASSKRWLLLYNAANQACGVFSFEPTGKSAWSTYRIVNWLAPLLDTRSVTRDYLFVGGKTEGLSLFKTMARGYPLGAEQRQGFDVIWPPKGARFCEGEQIEAIVAGNAVPADLRLRVDYPDGTSRTFDPAIGAPCAGGASARLFELGAADGSHGFGEWTLAACGVGSGEKGVAIEVAAADHPRAIFSAAEFAAMRNRWAQGSATAQACSNYLSAQAGARFALPALNAADGGAGNAALSAAWMGMLDYAAYLTMEPDHPSCRARMWADFDAMIRWDQWRPFEKGKGLFDLDDQMRGEMLMALALTFDWHAADLAIGLRREYAELLAGHVESVFRQNLAAPFPPKWKNNNWNAGNRCFSQNMGVAAAERAIAPYIPSRRRGQWRALIDENFENAAATLAGDGSYHAGYSYNAKALTYFLIWAETRRLNGHPDVFAETPWLAREPYYELYGMIPGNGMAMSGCIPFGDAEIGPYGSHRTNMSLLAKRQGGGVAQWVANRSEYDRIGPYPFLPFWHDDALPETPPESLPNWHYFADRGLFVFRSDWNTDAMYFASKCGPMWGGHEHPDAGTFVLYRDGVPFVAPTHYILQHTTKDENILTVNGRGPAGGKTNGYADPSPPERWGETLTAFGSPDYFNVLANPAPAYDLAAGLECYTREFVGFDDMVILRDKAHASAPASFVHQLHGYKTYPQEQPAKRYDPYQYNLDYVFRQQSTPRHWRMNANESNLPGAYLHIRDLSPSVYPWSVETRRKGCYPAYVPGYIAPGSARSANSSCGAFNVGHTLWRTLGGVQSAESLQALYFGLDAYSFLPLADEMQFESGVLAYEGDPVQGAKRFVAWPLNGAVDGYASPYPLSFAAEMAFWNFETGVYGGRGLLYLTRLTSDGGETDLARSLDGVPIDLAATLATGGRDAWIGASCPATVQLYCPGDFNAVLLDGESISFSKNGDWLTVAVPAVRNGHLAIETRTSARGWDRYR